MCDGNVMIDKYTKKKIPQFIRDLTLTDALSLAVALEGKLMVA